MNIPSGGQVDSGCGLAGTTAVIVNNFCDIKPSGQVQMLNEEIEICYFGGRGNRARNTSQHQRLNKLLRTGREDKLAWIRQQQLPIERLFALNQIEQLLACKIASCKVTQHVGIRPPMHARGKLLLVHLVSAQLTRERLPGPRL